MITTFYSVKVINKLGVLKLIWMGKNFTYAKMSAI